jgi:hypothetical protein
VNQAVIGPFKLSALEKRDSNIETTWRRLNQLKLMLHEKMELGVKNELMLLRVDVARSRARISHPSANSPCLCLDDRDGR